MSGRQRRVWHIRHALTLFEAREDRVDESLEVVGPLVVGPALFVDVELEYEERAAISRRAVGQEELNSRFCQSRLNHYFKSVCDGVFLSRFGDDLDRDHEAAVEIGGRVPGGFHEVTLRVSRLGVMRQIFI